jgi:hypothetical protein
MLSFKKKNVYLNKGQYGAEDHQTHTNTTGLHLFLNVQSLANILIIRDNGGYGNLNWYKIVSGIAFLVNSKNNHEILVFNLLKT